MSITLDKKDFRVINGRNSTSNFDKLDASFIFMFAN